VSQDIVLTPRGQVAVLAAIMVGVVLITLVLMHMWGEADRNLERASQEFVACMAEAPSPEAEALCEQEWEEAQDAYFIP
jgi:hypothetical protein